MAPPGFISDEQMAAIEAQQAPGFISDEQMLKLESVTGGQQFAGGIANMVPFNLGDEAMAGIRSLVDVAQGENIGDAYGRNLDQIRTFQKSYELSNPKLNIATSLAGSAPLAAAAPSLVAKASTPLRTLAALGIEGAGYGLGYGFGRGEGGFANRRDLGLQDAAVGAVAGPVIGGGLKFAGWLSSLPGKIGDIVKPFLESADDIAARQLKPSTSKILQMADDVANPLSQYRTLAEATQDPYLAQLEQQITKSTPRANDLLNANRAARQLKQLEMLNELSAAPKLSAEEGGVVMRELLEPQAAQTKQAAESLFEAINPGGKLPVRDVNRQFSKTLNKMYEAGGAPSSLTGIKQELSAAAAGPKAAEPAVTLFDQFNRPVSKATVATEATKPFSYMHSLRQRAQDAWVAAKNVGDNRAAAAANSVVRKIDDVIEGAAGEQMSAKDVQTFSAAKKAFEEFSNVYQEGPVGIALRKMGKTYQVPESSIPGMLFNGKAENTKRLIRALPDEPAAYDQARGVIRDKLIRDTANNDGVLSPGKFRTAIRQNREGLLARDARGRQLFDDEHIDIVDKIADDLAFLDPQSSRSVRSLAYKASIGQPTTAQALILQKVLDKGASYVPGANVMRNLAAGLLKTRTDAANDVLATALFDKDFAKVLLLKATPERTSILRSFLDSAGQTFQSSGNKIPQAAAAISTAGQSPIGRNQFYGDDASPQMPNAPKRLSAATKLGKSTSSNPPSIFSKNQSIFQKTSSGVPDDILDALKQQESGGDPSAVGPKTKYGTAKGAYQMLDETGKEYHKKLGIKEPYDPHNEKQQRRLAKAYMDDLLEMFDGDLGLALTAYHTGPGNVKKGKIGPIGRNYARSIFEKVA